MSKLVNYEKCTIKIVLNWKARTNEQIDLISKIIKTKLRLYHKIWVT